MAQTLREQIIDTLADRMSSALRASQDAAEYVAELIRLGGLQWCVVNQPPRMWLADPEIVEIMADIIEGEE